MSEELRQVVSDDAIFSSKVITGDESWICGYDSVQKEFVMAGQTVSSGYCCDILRPLCENIQRLHPELAVASDCTVSHFLFHRGGFDQRQCDCPPPTVLFSVSPS
jgi:hypothetical protein